jgi:hypothetical protein
MRPHRFDPLSFVAGAVFVLYAAVLLLGHIRIHDVRPSVLWIWPVLAFGALLTLYGARRLWEAREPKAVTAEEAPDEDDLS